MSDMIAIFGILLITALAFPALLFVVWLSFPIAVDRAQQRLKETPIRIFWLGVLTLIVITIPLLMLLNIPGPGQFLAGVIILVALTISTVGAAGMAAQLAERLSMRNSGATSTHASFLYGATVLELAVGFPVIGWLILLPVAIVMALGATVHALLRRPSSIALPPTSAHSEAVATQV